MRHRTSALQLAERVAFTLALGRFPLVLGGDCSILLGTALALRRRGRYGLFFLDGQDGLWPDELTEALTLILASPLAVGMDVTIYNPTFDDAERSAARVLAQAVTTASPGPAEPRDRSRRQDRA